jgi:hypothetical protein
VGPGEDGVLLTELHIVNQEVGKHRGSMLYGRSRAWLGGVAD